MAKINEDLQRERNHCTFNVHELTHFIDGGPEKTRERKERAIAGKTPLLLVEAISDCEMYLRFGYRIARLKAFKGISATDANEGTPDEYLSHKDKYEVAVKKSVKLFRIMRRMQDEGNSSIANYRDVIGSFLGSTCARDTSPLCLHYVMFMPAILSQANQEQQANWLSRAWNFSIIGSFAQTELGHGTFIRGLETTATYDASTRQFVLHSPTLSSYKWWPGGLGQTANYCIVVAQLYTKGKCHGIHSFMVQVRDEHTHEPLPGIKVGDIGAKLGLNAVNNGFLGFDNVRIPRTNMLMKHAQVLEDGTYVSSRNSKLNYGAMVFVRVLIVFDMVNHLSKAVTIATRYSAVRRQSELIPGEREPQILDYLTQQHKIFIGISSCLAFKVTGNKLWNIFQDISDELAGGNLERLSELHALACCLKAVCTSDTATFVERCRLACGGHGYMHSSNLPLIYGQATAACTYEGENTVLLLQTARFLVKSCHLESANLNSTTAYLKTTSTTLREISNNWENTVEGIIKGFQIVGARKIGLCVNNINKKVASGMRYEDAWNMTSVQLVAAAEVHCRVFILSSFYEEITKASNNNNMSSELKIVLKQLLELYAVYWALETLCDLLQYTGISSRDVDQLQLWYEELLLSIRPNAVGLVDAFDIRDEILHSALGAYDGRVYERLMEEALKSPLNAEPVNRSFHQYLKPFMQGKL